MRTLIAPFLFIGAIAACGDDTESGTSSGGGSSSDASTSTGSVASTGTGSSSDGGATGTGGDATGGGGGAATGGAGGGGGAPLEVIEGPGFRSGSRLRPVYIDGSDGARQLLHWYDTELGLRCRFSEDTAAGDTYSCAPIAHAAARIAFADDACTEPVMVVTDGECEDRFAGTSKDVEAVFANADTLMGRGTRTIYERGDELEPRPPVYHRVIGGECEADALDDAQRVHAAIAPIVPLVTATRELESLGDGLARAVAHGEDGSMQLMGPFHEDSASSCQYLRHATAEGSSACAPAVIPEFASATLYEGGYFHFADDACSVPAASFFTGDLPTAPPDYVVGPAEEEGELIAYERGEELDFAYSTHTGECAAYSNAVRHFEVGAPLLEMVFPHVFYGDVPGGRLSTFMEASASGENASIPYGFSDTAFDDTWCTPLVLAVENEDGAAPFRCIPGTQLPGGGSPFPSEGEFYAEPDCTDALVEFRGGVAYRLDEVAEPACSSGFPARDEVTEAVLFASYDGDVYQRWGDTCRAYPGNGYPEYFSRRVRDLEPEDFAVLTVVDPASDAP